MSDFNPQGPTQQPGCTGPFSDARDCPVHRPQPIPVEQTSAYQRGLAAGRREVLARVAKLPSPIGKPFGGWSACIWCGVEIERSGAWTAGDHPPNGCLWADAHAKGEGQ